MNQHQQNTINSQRKSRQTFAIISYLQIFIHLLSYLASFWKLIIVEGGGYADIGVVFFWGMTIVSLPLFLIGILLIIRSSRIRDKRQIWGYLFHTIVIGWSLFIVKLCYFW